MYYQCCCRQAGTLDACLTWDGTARQPGRPLFLKVHPQRQPSTSAIVFATSPNINHHGKLAVKLFPARV